MLATLIDDQLTPLTPQVAAVALRDVFVRLRREEPNAAQLAVLVAQTALETGNWHSLHRNNFGNEKCPPTRPGYYCQFRCNEVIKGRTEWFDPPHPQTNFCAFMSAADGAWSHLTFLLQPRFAKAWACVLAGDARGFVAAIKQQNYMTALLEPYVRAVVSLFAKYLPVCVGVIAGQHAEPRVLDPETEAQLLADMATSAQIDLSQTWQANLLKDRDAAVRDYE